MVCGENLFQFVQFDQLFRSICKVRQHFFRELVFIGYGIWNVQQRAGCIQNNLFCMLAQFCQQGKGFVIVILPDVLAVDNASEQNLVVWEALFCNQLRRLLALEEVQTDAIYVQLANGIIAVPYIAEIGLEQNLYTALCCQNASIQLCKQSLVFCGHIHD